jgi:hypothetical protein
LASSAIAQALEPKYEGGYPTAEAAQAAFDEYDYQAATQFYVWAYAYLNSLGFEKGLARLGGDERTFYIFDKRVQPQQTMITPNDEVVYVWSRLIDLSKGPVVFEAPARVRGHIWDMGMRAYSDIGDVGPDGGEGATSAFGNLLRIVASAVSDGIATGPASRRSHRHRQQTAFSGPAL